MRTLLLASALALAACSEKPPEPPTPSAAEARGVDAIIAADRAFAADGAKTGWVEAFEKWSEPDAIVLGDGPTSAKEFLANIDRGNRGDTSLHWAPEFAGASAAGEFGFTTGPFNGDGAAFGYDFTVWRKQPNGEWRWLYDGGVDTTEPTTIDPAFNVALIAPPSGGEGRADIAKAVVATLEAALAISAATDAPVSLGAQFAPISRMHRQDSAPRSAYPQYRPHSKPARKRSRSNSSARTPPSPATWSSRWGMQAGMAATESTAASGRTTSKAGASSSTRSSSASATPEAICHKAKRKTRRPFGQRALHQIRS